MSGIGCLKIMDMTLNRLTMAGLKGYRLSKAAGSKSIGTEKAEQASSSIILRNEAIMKAHTIRQATAKMAEGGIIYMETQRKGGAHVDQVEQVLLKINGMFIDLGFKEVEVDHYLANKREMNFLFGNLYCVPAYVETLGFIIEYAHSLHEAQHYAYGDGDCFPLELGEAAILDGIRDELRNAMSDLDYSTVPFVADMKVAV